MKNRVKELRQQKDITQLNLALNVGCSQNTISKIEIENSDPKIGVFCAIAEYFNVSLDYLLCRSDHRWGVEAEIQANKLLNEYSDVVLAYSKLDIENQKTAMLLIKRLAEVQRAGEKND